MRKGIIEITSELYEKDYHIVNKIFQYFKPLKMEYDPFSDKWKFYGTCDLFDEVNEGEISPTYRAIFVTEEGEILFKEFKKCT